MSSVRYRFRIVRSAFSTRRFGVLVVMAALLATVVGCGDGSSPGKASSASTERRGTHRAAQSNAAALAAARARVASRKRAAQRRRDIQRLQAALRARITDRRLFLMSDSVMLGAQAALPKALPTWRVNLDGKESRFFRAGLDVLRARRREIGQVVVIQMGNNYGGDGSTFRSQIDEAMSILAGVRWVVFVTVFEFRTNRAEVNNELRAAARRYPKIRIVDWNAAEHEHPGHTSRDGLHLKPSGALLMASVIASTVNALPGA